MSTQDLLAKLGIAPTDEPPEATDDFTSDSTPAIPLSETALQLDDWSKRRGREAIGTNTRLRSTFKLPQDGEMVEDIKAAEAARDHAELAAADFHAAAFEPTPTLAPACVDATRHEFIKQLLDTPDYQALHESTQLDELAAEIATGHFAEQYAELVAAEQKAEDEAAKNRKPGDKPDPAKEAFQKELRAMAAAGKATESAASEVSELNDAREAMGLGGNGGNPGQGVPVDELRKRFDAIKDNRMLRRIMQLAGRYRRLAQQRQRNKPIHGQDDMVGITLDGDIGRATPIELAMLADEDLELDAMRRLVERQLQCREYRAMESEAKGPIVVVVDESGSMSGEKIANAKALALALAWVARHQKRYCCLVGFAGGTEGNYCVLPAGKASDIELLDWLTHFYSGGTTCDVPLEELPSKWQALGCPAGKTDVITITDAIINVPDVTVSTYNAWRQTNAVKAMTIVVGCGSNAEGGDMARVSDRVYSLPRIDVEADAVAETLNI
jgi:uncharacterized protein with von Willebrand factor type A (vWA) domain